MKKPSFLLLPLATSLILLILGCGGDMPENMPCSFCRESCNGSEYNPTTHFCYEGQTFSCNNKPYNPASQFCSGNAIYGKCGGTVEYSPAIEQCCESNKYSIAIQFCSGNVIYSKCGGSEYSPSTQFCVGTVIYNKCGGTVEYNLATEQCCDSNKYAIATQFCSGNAIYNKCGGNDYSPSAQFCVGTVIYNKCGGKEFEPATQRCQGSIIETKCGSSWYDASNVNLLCQGNAMERKCGNDWYDDASMQFCSGGTLKTYKTVEIGTQTWLAENLNYNAAGSVCYNNSESNCAIYGRLYDYATAMALPSNCNSASCSSQISAKHRGICPTGWHLPTQADWDVLTAAVGGSSTEGKFLKAKNGWSNCGLSGSSFLCEDAFGFAALPGGGYSDGNFFNAGYYGFWWNAREYDASNAYSRYMDYSNEVAYWSNYSKSNLFSVRCVRD